MDAMFVVVRICVGFPPIMQELPLRRLDEDEETKSPSGPSPEQSASPVANALFKSRTVLIFGEIDMKLAERVTAQLFAYAAEGEGNAA